MRRGALPGQLLLAKRKRAAKLKRITSPKRQVNCPLSAPNLGVFTIPANLRWLEGLTRRMHADHGLCLTRHHFVAAGLGTLLPAWPFGSCIPKVTFL